MSDEKNVRLYFGRKPENSMKIDDFFIGFMEKHDYLIDKAVDELIHAMKTLNISINVFHTMNPLIPNYMLDKVAIELMWMIDEEGNHISMKDDMHLRSKLDWMAPGEALCDDARSFKSLPVEPQESVNK
jgi:hypothetical protein